MKKHGVFREIDLTVAELDREDQWKAVMSSSEPHPVPAPVVSWPLLALTVEFVSQPLDVYLKQTWKNQVIVWSLKTLSDLILVTTLNLKSQLMFTHVFG